MCIIMWACIKNSNQNYAFNDDSNIVSVSSENSNDGDLNNKCQGFEKAKGNNTDINKTENKIYKAEDKNITDSS